MNKTDSLVRKNIRSLIPYSSARDEFHGTAQIFLDANENPYGSLNRYPDPYHKKLRSAVGKIKSITPENIFLGNGSDEVIDLIYRVFCDPGVDKALTFTPTYGMYEVTAAVNDIKMIKIPLDSSFNINMQSLIPSLNDNKLKLIFICSPNNPTGNCFKRDSIIEIIEKFRGIVVIDEAYIDFSDNQSFLSLIGRYENIIVLQTFSKAWGAAAARVGMAFSNPVIIKYLYRVKPPYNISELNQKEALRRLEFPEKYRKQILTIKCERRRVEKLIEKLDITLEIYPSDANFLLVKVKDPDQIYKKLIEKGIIVRNRSSVVQNCLRITIGTKTENNKLVTELRRITI